MRSPIAAVLALLVACGGGRTQPAGPEPAGAPAAAATMPAPMIVIAYAGDDIVVQGPPDFAVVLVSAGGTKYWLSRHVRDWVVGQRCDSCGSGSHMPAEPPRNARTIRAGVVASVPGPQPMHVADATCPDGDSCLRHESVPDGDYEIVVDGLFACPPTSIHVPLTASVTVNCTRQ